MLIGYLLYFLKVTWKLFKYWYFLVLQLCIVRPWVWSLPQTVKKPPSGVALIYRQTPAASSVIWQFSKSFSNYEQNQSLDYHQRKTSSRFWPQYYWGLQDFNIFFKRLWSLPKSFGLELRKKLSSVLYTHRKGIVFSYSTTMVHWT